MFYVGGNCGNSNVELHDVRFSIGETPEDCHDDLREQWWAIRKACTWIAGARSNRPTGSMSC